MSSPLFPAVLTACLWGAGDFCIAVVSKRFGNWTSFIVTRVIILAFLTVPAVILLTRTEFTPERMALLVLTSFLMASGIFLFFKSLEGDSSTIDGVIAGSFSVVSVIISVIFLKEELNVVQTFSVISIIAGIMFSSLPVLDPKKIFLIRKTTIYAFITMFLWGIYFVAVKIPSRELGWFWPVFMVRMFGLMFLPYGFLFKKRIVILPKARGIGTFIFLFLAAVLPASGDSVYNLGVVNSPASLYSTIASSSPIIFVVLSSFKFRQKIAPHQKIGMMIVICGILLLNLRG